MSAYIENFDDYNDGQLNGQDSWFGNDGPLIQGVVTKAGAKAVGSDNVDCAGTFKAINNQASGIQRAFLKGVDLIPGRHFKIGFYDSTGAEFIFWMEINKTEGIIFTSWDGAQNIETVLAAYVDDHWYDVEMEWDAANNRARGRIDGGAWSNWHDVVGYTAVGYIVLEAFLWDAGGGGAAYWDELGEGAPLSKPRSFGQII